MGTRLELQAILEQKLGSRNVYFQPPESIKISYPAIVYKLNNISTIKADDFNYKRTRRYDLQYISRDPDNEVIDSLLDLPYCVYANRMVIDNLYHDSLSLYF